MGRSTRRTAPLWVRSLDQRELHALAGKLQRDFTREGITDRQDWLLERCLDELDWRRTREGRVYRRCSCQLCFAPFPELEDA